MNDPLISVIVPTKNNDLTIKACLASIKQQDYKYIEIIVVDNFSTDKTIEIAKEYTKSIHSKGPERSSQRNYGVEKSKGKYIVLIDSDMILTEGIVSSCVKLTKQNMEPICIVIPEKSFGKGFWANCKRLERMYYENVDWIESARFFPSAIFKQIGGYNEDLISGEDWDLAQKSSRVARTLRIDGYILHNEGNLKLKKLLYKKYKYAKEISKYVSQSSDKSKSNKQMNPTKRFQLYFAHPKKLIKNPILGIGMLIMKSLEFLAGFAGITVNLFEKNV